MGRSRGYIEGAFAPPGRSCQLPFLIPDRVVLPVQLRKPWCLRRELRKERTGLGCGFLLSTWSALNGPGEDGMDGDAS